MGLGQLEMESTMHNRKSALALFASTAAMTDAGAGQWESAARALAEALSPPKARPGDANTVLADGEMSAQELLLLLTQLTGVVNRKTCIPVLVNVLIRANAGRIQLTVTDLDVESTVWGECPKDWDINTTVSYFDLVNTLKGWPAGVRLVHETTLRLTCDDGSRAASLACLPATAFPQMDDITQADARTVYSGSVDDFVDVFDSVAKFISTEETRYYLNGVHVEARPAGGGFIPRFVATDGHRLAARSPGEIIVSVHPDSSSAIIPRKAALLLTRVRSADHATLITSQTHFQFSAGNLAVRGKLIVGTFPAVDRVIPDHDDKLAWVEIPKSAVPALKAVMGRVAKTYQGAAPAFIEFAPSDPLKLRLTVRDHDQQETVAMIPLNASARRACEIRLDLRYLIDALSLAPSARLQFPADRLDPVRIEYPQLPGLVSVVMPPR